jgi:hypothetical protein
MTMRRKDVRIIAGAIFGIAVGMNYADTFHQFMSYISGLSANQTVQLGIQGFGSLFQPVNLFNQTFPLILVLLAVFALGALSKKRR